MHIPKTLLYSTEHLWAKADADDIWQVGITDYAQDLLGDVVFVEMCIRDRASTDCRFRRAPFW